MLGLLQCINKINLLKFRSFGPEGLWEALYCWWYLLLNLDLFHTSFDNALKAHGSLVDFTKRKECFSETVNSLFSYLGSLISSWWLLTFWVHENFRMQTLTPLLQIKIATLCVFAFFGTFKSKNMGMMTAWSFLIKWYASYAPYMHLWRMFFWISNLIELDYCFLGHIIIKLNLYDPSHEKIKLGNSGLSG